MTNGHRGETWGCGGEFAQIAFSAAARSCGNPRSVIRTISGTTSPFRRCGVTLTTDSIREHRGPGSGPDQCRGAESSKPDDTIRHQAATRVCLGSGACCSCGTRRAEHLSSLSYDNQGVSGERASIGVGMENQVFVPRERYHCWRCRCRSPSLALLPRYHRHRGATHRTAACHKTHRVQRLDMILRRFDRRHRPTCARAPEPERWRRGVRGVDGGLPQPIVMRLVAFDQTSFDERVRSDAPCGHTPECDLSASREDSRGLRAHPLMSSRLIF